MAETLAVFYSPWFLCRKVMHYCAAKLKIFQFWVRVSGRNVWEETGSGKAPSPKAFWAWYSIAASSMKIKKRSASLLVFVTLRLRWCWLSASTLIPRLWFCFMVYVEAEDQNNSPANVKSKDLHAGKHVIYSWPLESPFQMLDHVKPSINITCAGAFMGPHPLLLVCIPRPPQCCNQSCMDGRLLFTSSW